MAYLIQLLVTCLVFVFVVEAQRCGTSMEPGPSTPTRDRTARYRNSSDAISMCHAGKCVSYTSCALKNRYPGLWQPMPSSKSSVLNFGSDGDSCCQTNMWYTCPLEIDNTAGTHCWIIQWSTPPGQCQILAHGICGLQGRCCTAKCRQHDRIVSLLAWCPASGTPWSSAFGWHFFRIPSHCKCVNFWPFGSNDAAP